MRQKLSANPCGICRAPDGGRVTRLFSWPLCWIASHPTVLAYVFASGIGGKALDPVVPRSTGFTFAAVGENGLGETILRFCFMPSAGRSSRLQRRRVLR